MYRNCIFCSAKLGSNDSIEHFLVGKTLAFDSEKGRLWAVCLKCARWNLAPIEERWEAIDDAERLFRDTRLRAQSENVGLAKLHDGTRLIRVGAALPGELAVWRYGESLVQRRRRALVVGGFGTAAVVGLAVASVYLAASGLLFHAGRWLGGELARTLWDSRVVANLSAEETDDGKPARITRRHIRGAELGDGDGGGALRLRLSEVAAEWVPHESGTFYYEQTRSLVLQGPAAHRVLVRGMVVVNAKGARRPALSEAMEVIGRAGSANDFVRSVATRGLVLGQEPPTAVEPLALEMALHEEQERRAMDGELAELEAMWREAEKIAAIADALPGFLESDATVPGKA